MHFSGFWCAPTQRSRCDLATASVPALRSPRRSGQRAGPCPRKADGTTYTFAPGTFGSSAGAASAGAGVVTVTHTPLEARAAPSTGSLAGIRHFYDVDARDAGGQSVQPVLPYTVTITYGPADLTSGRVISSTLALYLWDGSAWEQEPTSQLDVEAYTVTATPSHFSTWAVLGEPMPGSRVYLPLVTRGGP